MERYNDIRGLPYPFNLTSIRSFSSPSPITMSTSCPLGIAFAVRPSAVAFSSTQPFSSCTKPFARSTWPHAGGGEEGRDILFELLAREAQLQKVGRTKGPMLVEVELFAAGLTAAAAVDGGKVLAAPLVPRFCQQFAGPERPAALARSQRTVQVLLCGLPLRRIGQLAAAEDHRARVGSFGGQNKSARYRKSASGAFSIAN